jgi:hypothetical protein
MVPLVGVVEREDRQTYCRARAAATKLAAWISLRPSRQPPLAAEIEARRDDLVALTLELRGDPDSFNPPGR